MANLYRQVLFEHGQATEERRGFSPEQVRNVIEEEEDLRRDQLLRCRVRYFTDGVVLGGRAFVEEIFQAHRVQFGPKRKSGAQKMRGGDWAGLCTARDLRMRVIAVS